MKVLIIFHLGSLSSGADQSCLALIKYLKSKQVSVRAVMPLSCDKDLIGLLKDEGVRCYKASFGWWNKESIINKESTTNSVLAVQKICTWIKKYNPDVVVTNTLVVPWMAIAAAITNKPHLWLAREFPAGDLTYLKERYSFVESFSNIIMANSKALARELKSSIKQAPVGQFYSYVSTKKIKLNTENKAVRLFSINNLNNHKNQQELIKAVAILRRNNSNFKTKTAFIGKHDRKYFNTLKNTIKQFGLEDLFIFYGYRKNPWELVSPNDILVQTSISESIGRTTIEAMKLGVSVIASNIPGHIEAVALGGGTIYKSGSPEHLAKTIEDSIANINILKKKAQDTRAKIIKTMNNDACSLPVLKVLESLIGQMNPRQELAQISPFFNTYSKSREHEIKNITRKIKELENCLHDQANKINELNKLNSEILNSTEYKLGSFQIKLFRQLKLPKKEASQNDNL